MNSPADSPVTVLVGYDGSIGATTAIDVAARLLPGAAARVLHLWEPPFGSMELRHRLVREAADLDQLMAGLEREGAAEAERVVALGVGVARAAGWAAEPVVVRSKGGDGYEFARLAEQHGCSVVVVGSRGLAGAAALLGSVSEAIVHVSPVPVLVVPHPLTELERQAAGTGPVLVGVDASTGSAGALARARTLFPGRTVLQATVGDLDTDDPADDVTVLARRGMGTGGVAAALDEFAAEQGAGVVVVGSQGHSTAREVLLGSVVRELLHRRQRPVLVVPQANRFTG